MKKILLNKKKILKIGLIGYNKSNGHFFSFPAIINGYSKDKFKKLNFPKILKYLEKENKNKFDIKNAKITNIWCQKINLSKRVSEACGIKIVNKDYQEMAYEVDAVIVARDDWKSHYKISKFFLSKNIKVFVDKPLTLSKKELIFFTKYLKSKLLMSCSALRFAKEYKKVKNLKTNNIHMYTINSFDKYLIHMVELAYIMGFKKINSLKKNKNDISAKSNKGSIKINLSNKKIYHYIKLFKDDKLIKKIYFNDNFNMFKGMLKNFISFCNNKKTYSYKETIDIINNTILFNKK